MSIPSQLSFLYCDQHIFIVTHMLGDGAAGILIGNMVGIRDAKDTSQPFYFQGFDLLWRFALRV